MAEYHGIWRNITEYGGISRNMAEYHGIWRNITEYGGISRNMAEYHGIWRNITTFSRNIPEHHKIYKSKPAERRDRSQSNGSHAPVYKHGRLTTYFITKVMDLSHFEGK
jgi:hypothetical protein